MPFFDTRTLFKTLLLGLSSLILFACDNTPDGRYFTKPNFTCVAGDAYCNETAAAGLDDKARYGKGAAMVDVNNDGWQDMFLSDADPRTWTTYGVSAFYINNQDGTFTRDSLGISEDDLSANWVASFADYDRDGDQDVVLLNGGYASESNIAFYENQLNESGEFVAKTAEAGLAEFAENIKPWWGVSWADYDNDGYADFAAQVRRGRYLLFHNNGDGTFTELGESVGIDMAPHSFKRDGKNVVWIDHDMDGDQDLYFAGMGEHDFFENLGDGTFRNITDQVFAEEFPPNRTYAQGAPAVFAAAAIDFNQDGAEDLYLGRQAEWDYLLINDGAGNFSYHRDDIGLDELRTPPNDTKEKFENTMGMGVVDLYDDGYPDVIMGTGTPMRADEDLIYCNKGGKTFERCTDLFNGRADGPHMSRTHGVISGDVNRDGKTDVWVNQGGHTPWDVKTGISSREIGSLYLAQDGLEANTATITLQGTDSNRDAFGARITVTGSETHYYYMKSTQAFQSQNSKAIVVTLGDADSASVKVDWPSGKVSEIITRPGEFHHIVESSD
jgi:hypothetical protein